MLKALRHRTARAVRLVLPGTVIVALMGGCASDQSAPAASNTAPMTADPLATVPDDLTIDLRVLAPARPGDEQSDVLLPAGRVLVLPDGAVHGELNGPHHARVLPGQIRRLDQQQLAELWSLLHEFGLLDADSPASVNPMLIVRPESGRRYVLDVRAGDHWWQIRRDAVDASSDDPVMRHLTQRLYDLAWLRETAEQTALIAPRRYDFGPDPYARYRNGE